VFSSLYLGDGQTTELSNTNYNLYLSDVFRTTLLNIKTNKMWELDPYKSKLVLQHEILLSDVGRIM
jgi:hypothetical protein